MKTKKEFKYFSIFNHEGEQEYLSKMHGEGWRFVKVTGFGVYHFEECEPMEVSYQLDYNQEGIAHKSEYVQMFADCGWEYIQDYAGYSYFRKPTSEMSGDEEIFCDDESRLAMMERVYKGRLLPLVVLFSACLVPQFILSVCSYKSYGLSALFGGIIVFYLTIFAAFGIKYSKFKKNIRK